MGKRMKIIGLTGSYAMGKSTTSRMLQRRGVPIFDADYAVNLLYRRGGRAVPLIANAFPGAVVDGAVDTVRLAAMALGNPEERKRLEAIVHPMVRAYGNWFLKLRRRQGRKLVVLDVPLLFEGGGEKACDEVMVVSAPLFLQRLRALQRTDVTEDIFNKFRARQMPDHEKRRRADIVIRSGLGKAYAHRQLMRWLAKTHRKRKTHLCASGTENVLPKPGF